MAEVHDGTKYVCSMCTYIYDPAEHNGMPFSLVSDTWMCPVCGVFKEEFEPLDDDGNFINGPF